MPACKQHQSPVSTSSVNGYDLPPTRQKQPPGNNKDRRGRKLYTKEFSRNSSTESQYVDCGDNGTICGRSTPSSQSRCGCQSSGGGDLAVARTASPCLLPDPAALRRLSAAPGGGAAAAVLSLAQALPHQEKPVLRKEDAIDLADVEAKKKMERGISHATANESLVSAARNKVQKDFHHIQTVQSSQSNHQFKRADSVDWQIANGQCFVLETPLYTFSLPDLTNYPEDFRGFLEKDLIELSALISLEQCGRLNWWADTGTCQRLWPLATTGDGNCLLHAASLGMWGFHDRLLTLRKALYTFLTSSGEADAIYRRWRWQCAQQNYQSGLALTETEWTEEWSSVLKLASTEPRPQPINHPPKRRSRLSTVSDDDLDNPLYESLEEIHVLVLSHVLRRPIIVVADTILKDANGEALAPIPFGGIYLPLEFSPSQCDKCPLILTYDAGHFSALVTMQSQSSLPSVIPVTDSNHHILPIQFSVDPGFQIDWGRDENNPIVLSKLELQESDKLGLVKEFLDIVQVPLPACFLDNFPDFDLTSPESLESVSLKDLEVASQTSQDYPSSSSSSSKSKTAKQIQSVAKQFGSIGKTVSKKIKKNFGNITRLARTGSFKGDRSKPVSQTTRLQSCRIVGGHQDHILAAMIHTDKCLPYLEEMITNYLHEAKIRFDKDKQLKNLQAAERKKKETGVGSPGSQTQRDRAKCASPQCQMVGSERTAFLCQYCYHQQQVHSDQGALYGSGKSKFYVNTDDKAYEGITKLPSFKHATLKNAGDQSIYLANSTFYRDNGQPVVPVPPSPPVAPIRVTRKKALADLQVELRTHLRDSVDSGNTQIHINSHDDDKSHREPIVTVASHQHTDNSMKVELPGMFEARACQTSGCSFFGSSETNSFCSACYRESRGALIRSVESSNL